MQTNRLKGPQAASRTQRTLELGPGPRVFNSDSCGGCVIPNQRRAGRASRFNPSKGRPRREEWRFEHASLFFIHFRTRLRCAGSPRFKLQPGGTREMVGVLQRSCSSLPAGQDASGCNIRQPDLWRTPSNRTTICNSAFPTPYLAWAD